MDHDKHLDAAFEIARRCSPAGRELARLEAELQAEIAKPAFMRSGDYKTPELMARWRLLDDEADRQAAKMVFATPVQS